MASFTICNPISPVANALRQKWRGLIAATSPWTVRTWHAERAVCGAARVCS